MPNFRSSKTAKPSRVKFCVSGIEWVCCTRLLRFLYCNTVARGVLSDSESRTARQEDDIRLLVIRQVSSRPQP